MKAVTSQGTETGREKEGMERGDRWASSSVSSAKGSVARETSAMGVKRQGPWPEGWDPAAYIGGPEGLSRTRGLGVGGEGVGGWGRAGKKKMGSTANTGSQLKKIWDTESVQRGGALLRVAAVDGMKTANTVTSRGRDLVHRSDCSTSSEGPMDSSSDVYGRVSHGKEGYTRKAVHTKGKRGGAHMRRHHQGPMWRGATHRLYGTKSLAGGMW